MLRPGLISRHGGEVVAPPSYADEVLADSPLLYWRLGESSGTTAQDATANDRDGTYGQGVSPGTAGALVGDADTAVTSGGDSGTIESSYNPFSGQFTFECWVKRANTDGYDTIFSGTGDYPSLYIEPGADGNDTAFIPKNSVWPTGLLTWTGSDIPTGTWTHVVLTWDDSTKTAELFLNGVSQGQQVSSVALAAAPGNFRLGHPSISTWLGSFDECAVYSGLLSSTRIAAHYAAG